MVWRRRRGGGGGGGGAVAAVRRCGESNAWRWPVAAA